MYLESIKLHNFRCFSDLEVDFNKQLNVIVGSNGAGKSAILEAASIAAGTFTSALDGISNYGIRRSDARYQYYEMGGTVDSQAQFPVSISAKGKMNESNNEISWTRSLNSSKGRGGFAGARQLTDIALKYQERLRNGDTSLILPVISYYGTGRLWAQHREKKFNTFEKNTRTNGYIDSLDGAASDKLIMKWFEKMTVEQYRNSMTTSFRAVCNAIEKCFSLITGHKKVEVQYNFDINDIDIIYEDNNQKMVKIPIYQLSDGYRCTISLITDIAYRMALLNPQLGENVISKTNGIVLIDEIDLHLHPIWQQRIINDLMTIFPEVQFIVSTHAPAVINSIKSEYLLVLNNHKVYKASNETFGKDANTILREVMNTSERPSEVKLKFQACYEAIDDCEYEKALEIVGGLERMIGSNDPELNSCRLRIELEQM